MMPGQRVRPRAVERFWRRADCSPDGVMAVHREMR
jgi:hypothetical protein